MLEMELIKKLQNTQAIQKQAYAELENALAKPQAYTAGGLGGQPFAKGGAAGGMMWRGWWNAANLAST